MGCFSFRARKSSRRKGKKRQHQDDVGGGGEEGSLVKTRGTTQVSELTSVDVPRPEGTTPLGRSGEPEPVSRDTSFDVPQQEGTTPLGQSGGQDHASKDNTVEDVVVLRRDLPDGDHVSRGAASAISSHARPLTKEYLLSEIDSLRAELDMRREELQSLKQGYNELCDTADKLERARRKVGELTSRVEDLQAQLELRREAERKLCQDLEEARDALVSESREKELLSRRLDEAEYKLRSMGWVPSPQPVRVHS